MTTTAQRMHAMARVLHEAGKQALEEKPLCLTYTAVTVLSMHNGKDGQWILGSDDQDRALIAKRLRLCADILEGKAS